MARDISSHFMQQRRECESLRSAAANATANATGPGGAANTTVVCTPTPFDDVVERFTAAKPEGMPDACWRFDTGVRGHLPPLPPPPPFRPIPVVVALRTAPAAGMWSLLSPLYPDSASSLLRPDL